MSSPSTHGPHFPQSDVGLQGDDDEVDFLEVPAPVGALIGLLQRHHDR